MRLQSVVILIVMGALAGRAAAATLTPVPASHDFGNVGVSAGATPAFGFTLWADGSVTLLGFTTTGTCGEFTIAPPALPLDLANNESVTINVTYNPSDRTADACTITPTVSGGDTADPFTVTGDGVAPVLQVNQTTLAFADQRWNGGPAQTLNLTVTNAGEQTITAANITAVLATGTQFAIGAETGFPIASGQTAMIAVTFDPTSLGAKSDTVTVSLDNDAPGDANDTVSLTGTGTQSTQTFSPTSLNIGSTGVGVAATASIAIGNSGTTSLNLSSVRITGTNAADFALTDHGCSGQGPCAPSNASLAIGASTSFVIRCTPSAAGARTATLEVSSDDPASPRTAALSCTGTAPEVTVTPTSLAFGTVRVGQSSTPQGFTIANATGAPGLLYTVTEGLSDFSVACSPSCSGTLAGGATLTVNVTFTPTAAALRTGNVVVTTNDPDEMTVNVAVSGTGGESNLAMATAPAFGNVPVALVGGSVQNVTITNNGAVSLNTTSMTLTGDAAFSFAFGSGACTMGTTCTRVVTAAANGGTAVIPIRCDPTSAGSKMAVLNIQSDDPLPAGGTDVMLTCTGTVSAMTVMPGSLAFGNQRVNTSSTSQTITVGNAAGLAPLGYSVTAPAGGQFIVTVGALTCNPTCGNLSIAAGGSATVGVVFRPTSTGLKNGVVVVDDLDNFAADVNVAVSGTGVAPTATLTTAATLAFGNVRVNTTATQQAITVMNTGTMDLTISGVTETEGQAGENNFDVTGALGSSTIVAGGMQSWNVTCDPETRGAKTGSITIANDSANAPSIVVSLTCTSQEGQLVVTASPVAVSGNVLDFGPVALASTAMTTVTLTNPGNVDVTVASLAIAPTTQGFSNTALANVVVPANNAAARTFTVTFAPTLDTQGMATLTIDSDWNDPAITLRGDGEPIGFSCTPNPVMLGNVAWDGTQAQTITLRNTGTATVNVQGVAWLSGDVGEFAAIPANTGIGNLTSGQMRTFNITAVPTDTMLGARSAVLRVTTDLAPGMGQFCDIPVSYTSVGPAVAVTPGMTVDFGGVDIEPGPATIQLTLENTGTGRMDITSVTQLTGTFARTDFASTTIEPGASQALTISYDPDVERDAGNPEVQTFTIQTDGLFMGGTPQPAAILVTVRGHGVDRHIDVAGVTFPNTYRNPTEAQIPTDGCGAARDEPCAVRVCNTGGATLRVSMIADDGDAFALASTGPFDVGAGTLAAPTCTDVPVRFTPPAYGEHTADVTVMNDDDGRPMAVVPLEGLGMAREVSLPAVLELGDVPVGDLDLADIGLVVANDSNDPFVVREIRLVDGSGPIAFDLGTGGAALPVGMHPLDGTLRISTTGDFDELVELYLDGDPVAHEGRVRVTGRAVERTNYYSCSAGRARDAGAPLVLVLGLLAWRRRRYRRPCTPSAGTSMNGS